MLTVVEIKFTTPDLMSLAPSQPIAGRIGPIRGQRFVRHVCVTGLLYWFEGTAGSPGPDMVIRLLVYLHNQDAVRTALAGANGQIQHQ